MKKKLDKKALLNQIALYEQATSAMIENNMIVDGKDCNELYGWAVNRLQNMYLERQKLKI